MIFFLNAQNWSIYPKMQIIYCSTCLDNCNWSSVTFFMFGLKLQVMLQSTKSRYSKIPTLSRNSETLSCVVLWCQISMAAHRMENKSYSTSYFLYELLFIYKYLLLIDHVHLLNLEYWLYCLLLEENYTSVVTVSWPDCCLTKTIFFVSHFVKDIITG